MLKIKNILTCAISISLFLMSSTAADATQTAEDLRNSDISKLVKQSKFDSRDYGIVTPVEIKGILRFAGRILQQVHQRHQYLEVVLIKV